MYGAGSTAEKPHASAVDVRDGLGDHRRSRLRRRWILLIVAVAVVVIAAAVVGALIAKNVINVHSSKSSTGTGTSSSNSGGTATEDPTAPTFPTQTACSTADDIPAASKGTWMDPTSWLDKKDFNCTFTDETVGGLPVVGLFSKWDDSKSANTEAPALNKPWGAYSSRPIRGVNLGGWLSLEPFITPSLFGSDPTVVDEYTLCQKLGPTEAKATLEKHYSTFITEDDIKSIAAAGLDHIRIPFSYWAVTTYENDPYVFGVSWRYLLRGIEWARKYGLRVKLDLHGAPGSQNGWNHSGRSGTVDWITGPDGALNAQRTLDIHGQLSKFFAQDRYKNVVAFYGLINEPALAIPQDQLIDWTEKAFKVVKDNGVNVPQVINDAGRGLVPWTGKFPGYGNTLTMDVHLYSIFDDWTVSLSHEDRITFACKTWTDQINSGKAGFGPVMVAEWSQAYNDCAENLNGLGNGARWTGNITGLVGAPLCPTKDQQCSCNYANADVTTYTSDYKLFLQTWTAAQMSAFETSFGWFYWTWKTESAALWSYQAGIKGNTMPALAYKRDWDCSKPIPSFGSLPEYY